MGKKTVSNSMQETLKSKGIKVGKLSPSKESKGSWGETYLYNDEYYFCCYSSLENTWLVFILKFDKEDLYKYVDDELEAKKISLID